MDELFLQKCLFHIHDGLCNGLTRFSGPSRCALLYSVSAGSPLRIYDPQDLLRGHEPRLTEFYLRDQTWLSLDCRVSQDEVERCADPDLAGLIAFGGHTKNLFYQMWFTERHVDMCSIGPTEHWLEHACRLLSQDLGSASTLDLGTSEYVLQGFATHAVRDHITDTRNVSVGPDTQLRTYPLLEAVLAISKTQEEGRWPYGDVIFVEPGLAHSVHFLATFGAFERPAMKDIKHIRKLLQTVEGNRHKLVSDGREIIGIGTGRMPDFSVMASFRGRYGFIEVQDELVCSFADGGFHSSNRRANMVQLEELLVEQKMPSNQIYAVMKTVTALVESAQERKHGCTLVLDQGLPLASLAGQHLAASLDLRRHMELDLAKSLAKVDGALHIDMLGLKLHAFAALLDGRTVPGENRARGARFNSALRFSAEHEQVIVIVVSSDRPISIIQHGAELTASCDWKPKYQCLQRPPLLADWVNG